MKNITFKQITINNFKGVITPITQSFESKDSRLVITAPNNTGKTTKLDAITYLLTNKLLSGQTTGWEHLNENNELTSLPPLINLHLMIDTTEYHVKLENRKRYINDISFTSFKDFQVSLEKLFGFSIGKLHQLVSPKYFLEYVDTKTARTLFLESYPQDLIESEVRKINQEEFPEEFWNKIKVTSDVNTLLTSIRSERNQLLTKIKVIEENQLDLKEIRDDEVHLRSKLEEVSEIIRKLSIEITQKESSLKINCSLCGQVLPGKSELDKEKLNDEIKMLKQNLSEFQRQKDELTPQVEEYHSKLYFNENITRLQKQKDEELHGWKERIESLTVDEINIQNYQDLRIQALKNLIKESNLPFDLKLFHKNKTTNGYVETFTVLSQGVDYKFLNNSQKLLIGIELSKFFQNQLGVQIQMLIDDFECLDQNKVSSLSDITFIAMKVGN